VVGPQLAQDLSEALLVCGVFVVDPLQQRCASVELFERDAVEVTQQIVNSAHRRILTGLGR
jgi:hypothetical protein